MPLIAPPRAARLPSRPLLAGEAGTSALSLLLGHNCVVKPRRCCPSPLTHRYDSYTMVNNRRGAAFEAMRGGNLVCFER